MANKKSDLVCDIEHCFVCKKPYPEMHHVFFGSKRDIADRYKYIIPLCNLHHTGSKLCPHKDRDIDLYYKQMAQGHFECVHGTRNEFIQLFGKSYL